MGAASLTDKGAYRLNQAEGILRYIHTKEKLHAHSNQRRNHSFEGSVQICVIAMPLGARLRLTPAIHPGAIARPEEGRLRTGYRATFFSEGEGICGAPRLLPRREGWGEGLRTAALPSPPKPRTSAPALEARRRPPGRRR